MRILSRMSHSTKIQVSNLIDKPSPSLHVIKKAKFQSPFHDVLLTTTQSFAAVCIWGMPQVEDAKGRLHRLETEADSPVPDRVQKPRLPQFPALHCFFGNYQVGQNVDPLLLSCNKRQTGEENKRLALVFAAPAKRWKLKIDVVLLLKRMAKRARVGSTPGGGTAWDVGVRCYIGEMKSVGRLELDGQRRGRQFRNEPPGVQSSGDGRSVFCRRPSSSPVMNFRRTLKPTACIALKECVAHLASGFIDELDADGIHRSRSTAFGGDKIKVAKLRAVWP
ncbi:hypothetical protein BDK51DRAFT_34687 [Blyttiomyces helicus]|uniref:Uncharacterized protein n=1 Tax=Blyttiomyces helicus TaxID=388810 RepID=A0A4P9WH06_9FUNG|nr:hypothetical protein BDK51DRAFT_34687 [Blyttiomyces helicus]|eukprot:RKO92101.1 hypothetical protein BDK51DRAFT_34687 [Blyttiomyces helicus]